MTASPTLPTSTRALRALAQSSDDPATRAAAECEIARREGREVDASAVARLPETAKPAAKSSTRSSKRKAKA